MTLDEQVARLKELLPKDCHVYEATHGSVQAMRRCHDPIFCCIWWEHEELGGEWETLLEVTQNRETKLWTVASWDEKLHTTGDFEEAAQALLKHWPSAVAQHNQEIQP